MAKEVYGCEGAGVSATAKHYLSHDIGDVFYGTDDSTAMPDLTFNYNEKRIKLKKLPIAGCLQFLKLMWCIG
ncbi:conserved hypothetical protein [Ricinus communis]|uniref:Uncharacterized protein n=1 Tax=Ricinus communis TaxID=3988 RepID=B9R9T5_RICCO|nr:conserved hypothetical protein [Ricinus communis]